MLRVIEYFAKSLKVIEMTSLSKSFLAVLSEHKYYFEQSLLFWSLIESLGKILKLNVTTSQDCLEAIHSTLYIVLQNLKNVTWNFFIYKLFLLVLLLLLSLCLLGRIAAVVALGAPVFRFRTLVVVVTRTTGGHVLVIAS